MSSRIDIFRQARLKLTAFYALSVFLIVVVFSLGVYFFYSGNIVGNIELEGENAVSERALEQEFVNSARQGLKATLLGVDLSATLVAVIAGWLLAGRTLRPLQTSMQKHRRFVSDAAHELRTPLSVMKAGLETVNTGSGPTLDDYLHLDRDLSEEIDRMTVLTNDLLFLARGDQAALASDFQQIDLTEICVRQVKMVGRYAGQQGVKLRSSIGPGIAIQGDEGQIERLVLNLLKNAIDYNHLSGEARLSLKAVGKKAVMAVADTGIGISREELSRVFGRFYKADGARRRSGGGAGLGLSIAREIVRAHGGEVKIDSSIGEGTTVTAVFELAAA